MNKIDYILYILKWVSNNWEDAKRIIYIIENNMYTEDYINSLVNFLKLQINLINDESKRKILENKYSKLIKIREKEEEERKNELELYEKEIDFNF